MHLTALCLEAFRRPAAGVGFVFYSPRSGCWVELYFSRNWNSGLMETMCFGAQAMHISGSGNKEPQGQSCAARRACKTPAQFFRTLRGFCPLIGPKGAMTWSLSLQSRSRFQNELETKCATKASAENYQGLSWENTEDLWMNSWIKELKHMWWGIIFKCSWD